MSIINHHGSKQAIQQRKPESTGRKSEIKKDGKEETRKDRRADNEGEGEEMSLFHLEPHEYQIIEFTVLSNYRLEIHYIVNAEYPISVVLINEDNIENFENDDEYYFYGQMRERRSHDVRIKLPYTGRWNLAILNDGDNTNAINYEILLQRR